MRLFAYKIKDLVKQAQTNFYLRVARTQSYMQNRTAPAERYFAYADNPNEASQL